MGQNVQPFNTVFHKNLLVECGFVEIFAVLGEISKRGTTGTVKFQ